MIVCRSVRVGELATDWNAGEEKLGVKLPAWVARHCGDGDVEGIGRRLGGNQIAGQLLSREVFHFLRGGQNGDAVEQSQSRGRQSGVPIGSFSADICGSVEFIFVPMVAPPFCVTS